MSNELILKAFGHRMPPYVDRVRLKLKDVDLSSPEMNSRLESGRAEMESILVRKKISQSNAKWAVAQTLDMAANQQLEELRRTKSRSGIMGSQEPLHALIRNLDRLVEAIVKLPAVSRGKLNKIIVQQDWQHFDTEIFFELIHAMLATSWTLSPACIGLELRSAIEQSTSQVFKDTAVIEVDRRGPPAVLEMWEMLPPKARVQIEEQIRSSPPAKFALRFFQELASALRALRKRRVNVGHLRPVVAIFGERVARLWAKLGLHAGRAYDWDKSRYLESSFQRFCRIALTIVGDDSHISERQISHIKVKAAAAVF
jgi:hypothetical protein